MSIAKKKSPVTMKKLARWMAPVAVASALVTNAGCATVQELSTESKPYGEQLKERVAQWDEWCKKEKLGPYLENPKKKHITTCDFLALKDKRWDPNADEFSRYAHSIKLPAPHDKPQAQYREGMTSKEYFEELCAKEAGQWVFKTVEGVEGILQARPVVNLPKEFDSLVFYSAEPFPVGSNESETWMSLVAGHLSKFDFFERKIINSSGIFERYYKSPEVAEKKEGKVVTEMRTTGYGKVALLVRSNSAFAKYGYVGRGVVREEFEKHAVSGVELVIFNTQTFEVVALFRDFSIRRLANLDVSRLTKDLIRRSCGATAQFRDTVIFIPAVLKTK